MNRIESQERKFERKSVGMSLDGSSPNVHRGLYLAEEREGLKTTVKIQYNNLKGIRNTSELNQKERSIFSFSRSILGIATKNKKQ